MSKFQSIVSGIRAMGGYPKWNRTKGVDINANCLGYENRQTGIPSTCMDSMHGRDGWRNQTRPSRPSSGQPIDPNTGPTFEPSFDPSENTQSYLGDLLGPSDNQTQPYSDPQGAGMGNWGQSSFTNLQSGSGEQQFPASAVASNLNLGRGNEVSGNFKHMDDGNDSITGFLADHGQSSGSEGVGGFPYNTSACSFGTNMDINRSSETFPDNTLKELSGINKGIHYPPSYIDSCFDTNTAPGFTHALGNSRLYLEQTRFSGSASSTDMGLVNDRSEFPRMGQSYGHENAMDTTGMWELPKDYNLNALDPSRPPGQMSQSDDTSSILSQAGRGLTAELLDSSTCDDLSSIEQVCSVLMSPNEDREEDGGPDEERRILRRREKNRLAAQKCRQKKRDASVNLVQQYQDLESSNTQLRYEIRKFANEKLSLEKLLTSHLPECTKHSGACATASAGCSTGPLTTCSVTTSSSSTVNKSPDPDRVLPLHQNPSSSSPPGLDKVISGQDHGYFERPPQLEQGKEQGKPSKRGPKRRQVSEFEKEDSMRLPEVMQGSMVIPTPIVSETVDRGSQRDQCSWAESGQPFNRMVHQGIRPLHATSTNVSCEARGSLATDPNKRGWSLGKDLQNAVPSPIDQSHMYHTTSVQFHESDNTANVAIPPQLSNIVGQHKIPGQITTGPRRPVIDHMTYHPTDTNITANRRSSEVTNQVQITPPGVPPLVISPPKCTQPRAMSAYTATLSHASPEQPPLKTSTSSLTSATASMSSSSSLPVSPQQYSGTSATAQSNRGMSRSKRGKNIDFSTGYNIPE